MSVIDCRGLACPEPVVTTKKALDQFEEGKLIVIVNNSVSCNNVERFALSQGCSVEVEERGEEFYIHIEKTKKAEGEKEGIRERWLFTSIPNFSGVGEDTLGTLLMRAFLKTLLDQEVQAVPDHLHQ